MRWLLALHRRLLPADPDIGWLPYLWLVYLAFFFIRYAYVPPGIGEWTAVLASLAIFLLLYFSAYWRRGWALIPNIAGIAMIGVAWAPANIGAGVFFIYAAAFAGQLGPTPRALFGIGAVIASALLTALAWQPNVQFWMPAVLFGALVGVINLYYAGQSRRDAALRLSQQEVRQLAAVAERERISRDLHDLLGHTLSLITLKAELAGRLLARDPGRAAAEIAEVEQVSRATLAQVREAVGGIRGRGLAGEIAHARLALKAAGVRLEQQGEPPSLPPAHEAVLAMVLREAVTNVVRHAQAQHCRLLLQVSSDELLLELRDDGRGGRITPGTGIDGMRQRLAAVGGRLEVGTEYGTRLRAWLPLAES
jgi:two-component system, NarL family, sensor histidine kinase DesK